MLLQQLRVVDQIARHILGHVHSLSQSWVGLVLYMVFLSSLPQRHRDTEKDTIGEWR